MAAASIRGHEAGSGFPARPTFHAVTVPDGQTTSTDGVNLEGWSLVGVFLASTLDGSTLAWTVSNDDSTYVAMYDYTGTIISLTAGASRYIALDPALYVGVRYIKPVVSSQTGATVITLVVRPIQ